MTIRMKITVVCLVIVVCFHVTDAQCTLPSDLWNSLWKSSEFGEITFFTSEATFQDFGASTAFNWTCVVSSGNKYVLRSSTTLQSASFGSIYTYYCFDFYKQSTNSYLYYHPTDISFGYRRFQHTSDTVNVSFVCSGSVDTAEYHVIVKSDSADANTCASALLGNFLYACASGSTDNGTINVCDTQTTATFNHSQCSSSEVLYSAGGVFNCVAKTSSAASSGTVYYQTLYNTDTSVDNTNSYRFVCLAINEDSSGTVSFTYKASACVSGQDSTTTVSVQTFEPLQATTLCPIDDTSKGGSNSGLVIGLIVGLLVLLAIIIGVLVFYFCFYKKDPNAGKPIVENTKPRFEDPDKDDIIEDLELVDTSSTPVTRDEITFEAMSPNLISNGRIPNGNPVSMSPTGTHTGNFLPSGMTNGSLRRDSGIAMTEKSSGRPTPRIGLNPSKESMVIFNGDEKVISGNDTRIVPNENQNARTFQMNNSMSVGGPLTLEGLDNEEDDELGELSPHRENMPYPSLPREKSNLMPPIETSDPEKDKE